MNRFFYVGGGLIFVIVLFVIYSEYNKAVAIEFKIESGYSIPKLSSTKGYRSLPSLKGMELSRYKPLKMSRPTIDSCFVEFEKTWFGTLEIDISKLKLPYSLSIKIGELSLNENVINGNRTPQSSVGYFESTEKIKKAMTSPFRLSVPFVALPNEKILPFDLDGVIPFKYLEITSGCKDIAIEDIKQLALTYDMQIGQNNFSSSDSVLNEVYELARHTIYATSFAGIYIDGFREVKPYEADAYINQLGHYAIDTDSKLARTTQHYLLSNGTWPTEWIMQSVFMAYEDYLRTGDKEFIRANFSRLKTKTLIDLAGDDYLISSSNQNKDLLRRAGVAEEKIKDIIDWPPAERDNYATQKINTWQYYSLKFKIIVKSMRLKLIKLIGLEHTVKLYSKDIEESTNALTKIAEVNTVVNVFHYSALKKLSYLAKEINLIDESDSLRNRALNVKRSILKHFFNKKKKLFVDAMDSDHSSMQANVFALRFGIVPEDAKETVASFVYKRQKGSVYLYQHLVEGLYLNGFSEEAYTILTGKGRRSWYGMKYNNASSMTTEAWDFQIKENMDLNHSWGTAPVNIIPRYVAGIRPIKPNFTEFIVAPMDELLSDYSVSVPTVDENITLIKKSSKNQVSYELTYTRDRLANVSFKKPDCERYSVYKNNVKYRVHQNVDTFTMQIKQGGSHKIVLSCEKQDQMQ